MAGIQIQGVGGTVAEVDTTLRAIHVTCRPFEVLGSYSLGAKTGIYTGLGAGSILFSARWGDATRLAAITRLDAFVNTTTAATAAGTIDRDLIFVRSFTASDTGQTAITLTGNNQKVRTSHGTSLFTDMRISGNGAVTAGTGTADAQALAVNAKAGTATEPIGLTLTNFNYVPIDIGDTYPIILAQNEGIRVRIPTAMPTTIAQFTTVNMQWSEMNAY